MLFPPPTTAPSYPTLDPSRPAPTRESQSPAGQSPVTQDEGEAPPSADTLARSVGMVRTRSIIFTDPFPLEHGPALPELSIAYETYGRLNVRGDNAILLCHALSGDAHAAGYHTAQDKRPGWWDTMVGPGKAFDTMQYYVICANVLGGCQGSTGPTSINPITGRRYGGDFPIVTIGDMVHAQTLLLDHLGVTQLAAVAGGSMGGMQALHWAVHYPKRVRRVVLLASCAQLTAQALAFNEVGRQAIMGDPRWRGGHYDPSDPPSGGLAAARMIGHLTYLSAVGMEQRFGRALQDRPAPSFSFEADFQVESYLRHQGRSFVSRFDPNSYLYITRAMDYFDLSQGFMSLAEALAQARAEFFIASVDTDWLYPTAQAREIVEALTAGGRPPRFLEISSPHGHDAFLIEHAMLTPRVADFLAEEPLGPRLMPEAH
ncbi:MAG TPA: homoserine O-acetyltransferase [Chloroflexota bacterium]|nr:homoserine O-acetyltransferase [Chloroflexota bacterium]